MAKKLYLDCQSGISGDMLVGALLDLGASEKILKDTLASLPLEGFEIEINRVEKAGLNACDFLVKLDAAYENHDHDMNYLHGEGEKEEHHYPHMHRGFPEVVSIIQSGKLTKRAKELAVKIFKILGEAEAKAHGTTLEEVHFHEVGAVDSIVDIVAAAVCLDNLGIDKVVIPVLCEGWGTVNSQHGILSIPVPAVANIIQQYQLIIQMTSVEGELITPTGAAIAAAFCTEKELPQKFSIVKSGIGAGKRQYERPSLLRAMVIDTLGEPEEEKKDEEVIVKLECNVDDCGGEAFGYCMEQLFAAGARDVFYIPVYMKKNRPAYEVVVICEPQDVEKMEAILFTETTTIGIRRTKMERTILKRNIITMESSFGPVQIKVCEFQDTKWGYPEYESIKKIAMKEGVSYLEVYQVVHEEVTKLMEKENTKKH
ncbi:MAG: nickel pincer cofactor biosynthesis protein LarC [Lachnospiraceae bacterium]|nr:nickel pincer cofactor biosynthesis protein LarC [Lachnospiraceae bacterium]